MENWTFSPYITKVNFSSSLTRATKNLPAKYLELEDSISITYGILDQITKVLENDVYFNVIISAGLGWEFLL